MDELDNNGKQAAALAPSGTVTFLFTDIEGSTKLLERLREQYAVLLDEQRTILRAAFARFHGYEIDTQGDSFFVAFPRSVDALQCVIETQRELFAHQWPQAVQVRVRMGLHTGEPIVGRVGYVGMDVHRAARIAASGHGGQVLISQVTRELVYQDLPHGASLIDLGEYKLKDIRFPQRIYQLNIEGLPEEFPPLKTLSTQESPPTPGEPPYKGLQYFDEADAAWFFGRKEIVERLFDAVQEDRFLAVIGASGSGKSSVVRAGLIPALKNHAAKHYRIFTITPTAHPLEALAISVSRGADTIVATATLMDNMQVDLRSLHLFIQSSINVPELEKVLVIVDQFEELFTQCRQAEERQAFIDNLLYALQVEGGLVSVIVALRADFYDRLAQYANLRELVSGRQIYIGSMSAFELRAAIEEPARHGGWELSPGLADLILHDIGSGEGSQPEPGALPLLSHALLETWKHRRGNLLNLRAYTQAGGVRQAIAHTADTVYYQELNPEQQSIARSIFLRLTELGEGTPDTRRRISITELIPPGPASDGEQIREVLVKLADARLITTGESTVEVSHEALIREWPTLGEWLAADREGLRLHRRLTEAAQEWELLEHEQSVLYRGARLAQAVDFALNNPKQLNAQEQAFLNASQEAEESERAEREAQHQRELIAAQKLAETERIRAEEQAASARRLRQRAAYLAIALVAALALAVTALFFFRRADQNAEKAQSQKATAQAETVIRTTAEAFAVQQRDLAEEQTRLTRSRELALASINSLENDPEMGILLAMQALSVTHTLEAESALHRALLASHIQQRLDKPFLLLRPSMAISPDGSKLAYVYFPSPDRQIATIVLQDNHTGEILLQVDKPGYDPDYHVVSIAFSPDSQTLAGGFSNQPELQLWDTATGQELRRINLLRSGQTAKCKWGDNEIPSGIYALDFSPNGKQLGTVECDAGEMVVRVRNLEDGQALFSTVSSGIADPFTKLSFSPDGKQIAATPTIDGSVTIYSSTTGEVQQVLKHNQGTAGGYEDIVRDFAFDPKANQIATVGIGGEVRIWDTVAGTQLRVINNESPEVWGVAFSPDGAQLATGSPDGKIRLWDFETGQKLLTLEGSDERVNKLLFSPDGHQLISRDFSAIDFWDLDPGHEMFTQPENIAIEKVAMDAAGTRLATGDDAGHVKIFESSTGQKLLDIPAHDAYILSVEFSPDGKFVASAGQDGSAKIWDVQSGALIANSDGQDEVDNNISYNAAGDRLAIFGCCNPTLNILDTATGKIARTIDLEAAPEWGSYDHAGGRLAIRTGEKIAILDADSGQDLLDLTCPGEECDFAPVFSPDDKLLAHGSWTGNVSIFDSHTGELRLTLNAHNGVVTGLAFSPNGRRLATAGSDGLVKLWDVESGQLQLVLNATQNSVWSVAFSPDGRYLYTGDQDGYLRSFILPLDDLISLAKTRVTRTFTPTECLEYRIDPCPSTP